uniref:Uncharacterized protein n=1 Tax=Rhizophora mucronata TaxID=61149 RepID=A0A2P2NA10_RHIMU
MLHQATMACSSSLPSLVMPCLAPDL